MLLLTKMVMEDNPLDSRVGWTDARWGGEPTSLCCYFHLVLAQGSSYVVELAHGLVEDIEG